MSGLRDSLRRLPDTVFADFLESDEEYLLVVDVPGVTAETASITTENGRLRIEARREKGRPDGYHYVQEERTAVLDTELPLPSDAFDGDATASIERGVLELRLPRRGSVEGTTIPIDDG